MKLDVVAVAYRGETAALPDVLSGRVDFGAPSVAVSVGQKLRILAVFADQRHPAYPDAPTFSATSTRALVMRSAPGSNRCRR